MPRPVERVDGLDCNSAGTTGIEVHPRVLGALTGRIVVSPSTAASLTRSDINEALRTGELQSTAFGMG